MTSTFWRPPRPDRSDKIKIITTIIILITGKIRGASLAAHGKTHRVVIIANVNKNYHSKFLKAYIMA